MPTLIDRPAILGGTPVRSRDYPSWPVWDDHERENLLAVLDAGAWWQGDGDVAATFAAEFASYQGARYGVAMTNGTHTLEAALAACDVGEGDEVIVPGITFVASATAALAVNATPVLVDVDPDTLCLDPVAAEAAITPRTKAIIVVHVAGAAADLDALVRLCARRGLWLIEDCAHAHGTFWRGRGVGSWGDFGSFSMQHGKLMTAGEGGVLLANDEALRDRAWSYGDCGRVKGEWFYHHPTYGSNLRMTEWQGAVLRAQLRRFPAQNRTRNDNATALNAALPRWTTNASTCPTPSTRRPARCGCNTACSSPSARTCWTWLGLLPASASTPLTSSPRRSPTARDARSDPPRSDRPGVGLQGPSDRHS